MKEGDLVRKVKENEEKKRESALRQSDYGKAENQSLKCEGEPVSQ